MVMEDEDPTVRLRISSGGSKVRAVPQALVTTYDEHKPLHEVETFNNGPIPVDCFGVPYSVVGMHSPEVADIMRQFYINVAASYGFRL